MTCFECNFPEKAVAFQNLCVNSEMNYDSVVVLPDSPEFSYVVDPAVTTARYAAYSAYACFDLLTVPNYL